MKKNIKEICLEKDGIEYKCPHLYRQSYRREDVNPTSPEHLTVSSTSALAHTSARTASRQNLPKGLERLMAFSTSEAARTTAHTKAAPRLP
jgi:hypothetical protein